MFSWMYIWILCQYFDRLLFMTEHCMIWFRRWWGFFLVLITFFFFMSASLRVFDKQLFYIILSGLCLFVEWLWYFYSDGWRYGYFFAWILLFVHCYYNLIFAAGICSHFESEKKERNCLTSFKKLLPHVFGQIGAIFFILPYKTILRRKKKILFRFNVYWNVKKIPH